MNTNEYHMFLIVEVSAILGSIVFISLFLYFTFVFMREENDDDSEYGPDERFHGIQLKSNSVKIRFSQPIQAYTGFCHSY